jgi:hypothetical protein
MSGMTMFMLLFGKQMKKGEAGKGWPYKEVVKK